MAALVALAAGIWGGADPVSNLQRAGLAYLLGWLCYQVWNGFLIGVGGSVMPSLTVHNSEKQDKTSTKKAA